MANRIDIVLTAVDRVSAVIGNIRSHTDSLSNTTQRLQTRLSKLNVGRSLLSGVSEADTKLATVVRRSEGLYHSLKRLGKLTVGKIPILTGVQSQLREASSQADIFWGNFKAGLAVQGVTQLTRAFGGLKDGIMSATKIQTKMLADAGGFSAVTGLTLGESKKFQKDLNIKLSKIGAELSGEAQDYIALSNQLAPVLVKSFDVKKSGTQGFEEELLSITKRAGFLGNSQQLSSDETGTWVNRFLSGGTFAEVDHILAFGQENQGVMDNVAAQMKALNINKEDFIKLAPTVKKQILTKSLKDNVSDELINEAINTTDAMLASIKDSLFSPLIGVFGMLRAGVGSGGRTTMDAFSGFLKSWMTLGSSVNAIAAQLGLSIDPLKPVVAVFDLLTDLGNYAALFLSTVNVASLGKLDMGETLSSVFKSTYGALSKWLVNFFNNVLSYVANFAVAMDTSVLVRGFLGVFHALVDSLSHALGNINWFNLGRLVGVVLFKSIGTLLQLVIAFDWLKVVKVLGLAIVGLFKLLGGLLVGSVEGLFSAATDVFKTWVNKVTDFFLGCIRGISDLWNSVTGWLDRLKPPNPSQVGSGIVQDFRSGVTSPISRATRGIKGAVFGVEDNLTNNTNKLLDSLSSGAKPLPSVPNNINKSQQISKVFNPVVNLTAPPGTDLEVLAALVVSRIVSGYDQYSQERLA